MGLGLESGLSPAAGVPWTQEMNTKDLSGLFRLRRLARGSFVLNSAHQDERFGHIQL